MASISTERLVKWVQMRSKDLENLNDLEQKIKELCVLSSGPEVSQAMKVLRAVIREQRLAIQIKMSEVRGKLGAPNAGKQFEPYEK